VIFERAAWGTLSEQHLEADVSGEIFDPARHTIFTEIKAVHLSRSADRTR
jgi:SHS2 domain-containing protein